MRYVGVIDIKSGKVEAKLDKWVVLPFYWCGM